MPIRRRTTALSFLGFVAVLCLAIIIRTKNVTYYLPATSPQDFPEYGDIIGIELGRTYSRVGIIRNDSFEIILDDQGRSMVPSYVTFTNRTPPLVGFEAMEQVVSNPKNTIYDTRRLIGRYFSDPELQKDIKDLPYDVVEKNGKPYIAVQIKRAKKYFTPEEISSKVLEKLKGMAEVHLNRTVNYAVATVPSYFNDTQRQSTKDAAVIAGLEILRLVNEPTAAGIAYGKDVQIYDKDTYECEECNFIIYNLGAKESDITLELVDSGVFEILAQAGDKNLGADDFENPLLNHIVAQLNNENNIDITTDLKAMKELKFEVEKAEQALSTKLSAKIEILGGQNFKTFSTTITQSRVEEMKSQLSDRTLKLLKQLLKDANIQKKEVDGIIITGDPAHIEKVQPLLEAYLDGKRALIPKGFSTDQAIVYGAAIQGQVLSSVECDYGGQYVDISLLSVGIETSGGVFRKLIPRNSVLPTLKTLNVSTIRDNQEKVVIRILEGERPIASKNKVVGTLELTGLPLKPKGVPEIEVVFKMNADQLLRVIVKEKESGKEETLTLMFNVDQIRTDEVDAVVMEAELHHEQDQLLLKEFLIEGQNGNFGNEGGEFGVVAK